jgi:hypothetical protein
MGPVLALELTVERWNNREESFIGRKEERKGRKEERKKGAESYFRKLETMGELSSQT